MNRTFITRSMIASCILATSLSLFAKEIPNQLPTPDGKEPDKAKPVKVYILSGQSNMVGMGTVNPLSRTAFNTYVSDDPKAKKGVTLSIYRGRFDPAVNYDKEKAVETHHVKLGYWPHSQFPAIEGEFTHVARGFIRIDKPGDYCFGSVANASVLSVDGHEIFRMDRKKKMEKKFRRFEKGTYPIEVKYHGGGYSNLTYWWKDVPGTLTTLVKEKGKYPHLLGKDGKWTVRNDVTYEGLVSAVGRGPLSPEVSGGTFGPELGFGHVMGYYHDEPVLIIKTSQGNRSLAWDFLPPGSKRYTVNGTTYAGYKDTQLSWPEGEKPKPSGWYAGKEYDACFIAAKEALADFKKRFPKYADQGYEIAGFAWWQGHKDSGNPVHIANYERNLVNLIKRVRKEFDAPKAPFVVATVGFHGDEMPDQYKGIFKAQLAVSGESGKHPEFKGNVLSIDTRPFWRKAEVSPQNQDYHYNRNAETYYLVGESIGRAMTRLMEGK